MRRQAHRWCLSDADVGVAGGVSGGGGGVPGVPGGVAPGGVGVRVRGPVPEPRARPGGDGADGLQHVVAHVAVESNV